MGEFVRVYLCITYRKEVCVLCAVAGAGAVVCVCICYRYRIFDFNLVGKRIFTRPRLRVSREARGHHDSATILVE